MISPLPTIAEHSSSTYERADAAARQLVGQAFLVPLLKEGRESTSAHGIFAPGAAEKRFGPIISVDEHGTVQHINIAGSREKTYVGIERHNRLE